MEVGLEIKFQAWIIPTGEMKVVTNLCFDEKGNLYGIKTPDTPINECVSIASVKLRQFTGLHDKNGKEIYEGDWLKDTESFDEVYFYCVVWSKSNCCFYFKDVFGTEHFGGEDLYLNQVEVIGNVFENPELLEVSE